MSADFGVTGSFVRSSGDNGVPSYLSLMTNYPSYFMLRDESNNPLAFQRYKSAMEIDRLKSIGLLDETYVPVDEIHRSRFTNDRNYYRLHAGMTFELAQGLNLDLKYQTENTFSTDRTIAATNSYSVRNMVNDAAQYNADTQEITYNIPTGEQLSESRSVDYSYTLRAQMNFNREFDERHAVTALAGAERRLVRSTGTSVYYMGYDDNSLAIKPFNPLALDNLEGTEALSGFYNWQYADYNKLYHTEDRFVSFYANASYTFDNRYSITGSVRMDQSNLFGTDPKYQYRPLWSLGASWYLGNEEFMKNISWIDLLNLRLTSGVGGNVPKGVGPYINVVSTGYLSWINAFGNSISYPPNSRLRWEKTVSNNLGIDFALFNSRVSGSIDLYHKSTTDLLGARNADPTLGWKTLTVNYGAMINKGVELSLQTVNVKSRNFSWSTNMMFGYNHNRLTNLTGTEQSVFKYVAYDVQAVGYPVNSLFSYRYAGLNPKNGSVMVYNGQDQKASGVSSVDELVYSGTRDPKYTASLKNTLSFGDFDLSFMFVYYGGHVMRDVVADYLTGAPSTNINRKALNHWRKAGDELIEGMAPAFNRSANYTRTQVWYSSDIHVKKADYIKLRDVSLSYTLPKKWLRPLSLTNAVLTCQVRDLWWWAANGDIDPEAYSTDSYGRGQLNLPNPTTYTFGISLNF